MALFKSLARALRGTVARNAIATTAVLFVRLSVLAIHMLLVARLLGAENFAGYVAVGALAVLLGGLSSFGTQLLVLRDSARSASFDALCVGLGTWRLFAPLLFCMYVLICQCLGLLSRGVWLVLGVGIAEFFLHPVLQFISMARQGEGAVAQGQRWLTMPLLCRASLMAFLWVGSGIEPALGVGLVHLTAAVVSLLLVLIFGGVVLPPVRHWRALSGRQWREAGVYAALGLTSGAQPDLDKIVALKLLPGGGAGIYAAASRMLSAVVTPVIALVLSSLPRLFARPGKDSGLLVSMAVLAAGYSIVAIAACAWLAPLLEVALGTSYEGVSGVLAVLVWGVPAQSLRLVVCSVLMAKGTGVYRVIVDVAWMLSLLVLGSGVAVDGQLSSVAWVVVTVEWSTLALAVVALCLIGRRAG